MIYFVFVRRAAPDAFQKIVNGMLFCGCSVLCIGKVVAGFQNRLSGIKITCKTSWNVSSMIPSQWGIMTCTLFYTNTCLGRSALHLHITGDEVDILSLGSLHSLQTRAGFLVGW